MSSRTLSATGGRRRTVLSKRPAAIDADSSGSEEVDEADGDRRRGGANERPVEDSRSGRPVRHAARHAFAGGRDRVTPNKHIDDDNDDEEDDNGSEPGAWQCTVCTFKNRYESFKCAMCESRKGTSTRKPRLVHGSSGAGSSATPLGVELHAVAQQTAALEALQAAQRADEKHRRLTMAHTTSSASPTADSKRTVGARMSTRPPRRAVAIAAAERTSTSHDRSAASSEHDDSATLTPPSSTEKKPTLTPGAFGDKLRASIDRSNDSSTKHKSTPKSKHRRPQPPLFAKFVDTNSARTMTVTVNDVTVVITDYTPL